MCIYLYLAQVFLDFVDNDYPGGRCAGLWVDWADAGGTTASIPTICTYIVQDVMFPL